jgi:holo-[acyl-carrier protein] synthase
MKYLTSDKPPLESKGPSISDLSDIAAELRALPGTAGVGLDLVYIPAFADLLQSGHPQFITDTWTKLELSQTRGDYRQLATRWAVKEAVMKALEHGLGEVAPFQIQTQRLQSGALRVSLVGAAARFAAAIRAGAWHVSVSHDADWAVAVALADRAIQHQRE